MASSTPEGVRLQSPESLAAHSGKAREWLLPLPKRFDSKESSRMASSTPKGFDSKAQSRGSALWESTSIEPTDFTPKALHSTAKNNQAGTPSAEWAPNRNRNLGQSLAKI